MTTGWWLMFLLVSQIAYSCFGRPAGKFNTFTGLVLYRNCKYGIQDGWMPYFYFRYRTGPLVILMSLNVSEYLIFIYPFLPREAMLSAVYAVVVCLCVCLSHSGIVSKRLNVGSRKQRCTIAP